MVRALTFLLNINTSISIHFGPDNIGEYSWASLFLLCFMNGATKTLPKISLLEQMTIKTWHSFVIDIGVDSSSIKKLEFERMGTVCSKLNK